MQKLFLRFFMSLATIISFFLVVHFSVDSIQARGMELNIDYGNVLTHEIVHTRERSSVNLGESLRFNAFVMANGNLVDFAVIRNGRSLVPIRNVSDELGYDISWNEIDRTATLRKDNTTIVISVGSGTMTVNGRAVTLDVAAEIIDGKTHIPLRAIGEAFGAEVGFFNPNALNDLALAHSIVWIDEQLPNDPIPLQTAISAIQNIAPTIDILDDDRYELHLGNFSRYYVFAGREQLALAVGRNLYYVNKFTGDVFVSHGGWGFVSNITLVANIR